MFIWIQINKPGSTMHAWLLKDINYVANDALKLNNAINTCLINLNVILNYSFFIKYSGILSMSTLSIALRSTEKS